MRRGSRGDVSFVGWAWGGSTGVSADGEWRPSCMGFSCVGFFFLCCFVTAKEHGHVVHRCVRRASPTAPGAFLICFWYVYASAGVVVFSSTAPAPDLVQSHLPGRPAASPNPTAGCRVRGDHRARGCGQRVGRGLLREQGRLRNRSGAERCARLLLCTLPTTRQSGRCCRWHSQRGRRQRCGRQRCGR